MAFSGSCLKGQLGNSNSSNLSLSASIHVSLIFFTGKCPPKSLPTTFSPKFLRRAQNGLVIFPSMFAKDQVLQDQSLSSLQSVQSSGRQEACSRWRKCFFSFDNFWVFPKIGGNPPKSSILIGEIPYFHHPFWGKTPLFLGCDTHFDYQVLGISPFSFGEPGCPPGGCSMGLAYLHLHLGIVFGGPNVGKFYIHALRILVKACKFAR